MKRSVLALVILSLMATGQTALFAAQPEYYAKIEKFFSLLKSGESMQAVDYIYSDNTWMINSFSFDSDMDEDISDAMRGALLEPNQLEPELFIKRKLDE